MAANYHPVTAVTGQGLPWSVLRAAVNPATLNGALAWAQRIGRKNALTVEAIYKYKASLAREKAKREGKRDPKVVIGLDEIERAGLVLVKHCDTTLPLLKSNIQFFASKNREERRQRLATIKNKLHERLTALEHVFMEDAA
jgi:hypothetical protein